MIRTIAAALLMLSLAAPTFAKTNSIHSVKGVYPVSCDDLWTAVKETLRDHNNYGLGGLNDLDLRASFIVIGDLWVQTDRVALVEKGSGCEMKTNVLDIGAENTNYRLFRSRVERELFKLQAAKTKPASPAPETTSSTAKPANP